MYWHQKRPEDNLWHPIPRGRSVLGVGDETSSQASSSDWLQRLDLAALTVDAGPLVLGAGALRYIVQAPQFGFTATANVFKNKPTIQATHRTAQMVVPLFAGLQIAGIDYRYYLPRWASDRDHRMDEDEVRGHVDQGMILGLGTSFIRSVMRFGPRWSIMDAVIGGYIADVLLREYFRAHNL